jgi:hypothetical protein
MTTGALRKRLGRVEASAPSRALDDGDLLARIAELVDMLGDDLPDDAREAVADLDAQEAERRAFDGLPDIADAIGANVAAGLAAATPYRLGVRWPHLIRVHDAAGGRPASNPGGR